MNEWFSAQLLAGSPGLPKSDRRTREKADRERWISRKKTTGKGLEYHISSLPLEARNHLAAQAANRKIPDLPDHAELTRLTGSDKTRASARLVILDTLREFEAASGQSPTGAKNSFCHCYNRGEIDVPAWVRSHIRQVHVASLYRWLRSTRAEGETALAGKYGNRRGSGIIDCNQALRDFIIGLLTEYPHITAKVAHRSIKARFNDIQLPGERALRNWVGRWREENEQLLTAVANPDAWKSKFMVAQGSASESVWYLNQLWELDSTPADIMLTDGRHSLVGVIDVYSRRVKLLVSKTSKATAIGSLMRRALLDWGTPSVVKTDNGQDYKSFHLRRVVSSLDIHQEFCEPFAPWMKPHVERFFRTFSHDVLELLPGFIGHNVAERQAIESRRAFSDRLFKKDGLVEIKMRAADLQEFCDQWLENVYHQDPHSGLDGVTPFARAARWDGETRRIKNERALDILLTEAPGDGQRTVRKSGVRLDGLDYIAAELGDHVGDPVQVRYDPDDIGHIYVFSAADHQFICIAECPEVTGVSREAVAQEAKRRQREQIEQQKRALKENAKQQRVGDIAREILTHRAAENNLNVLLHPGVEHRSAGLDAAALAAEAASESGGSDAPAPVDPEKHAEVVALFRQDERSAVAMVSDDPRKNYALWCRLDRQVQANISLLPAQFQFHGEYRNTPEWQSMKEFFQAFDLAAEDF